MILTVRSPPAHMKWGATYSWAGDNNARRFPGENIQTNRGGTLNPNMYKDYAKYLVDHIRQYKNSGVDVYALSLQNEPAFAIPLNKPVWMTETSGYSDTWEAETDRPGAFGLAMDIHSALCYGNIGAWVWWQGSRNLFNRKQTEPSSKICCNIFFRREQIVVV